MIVLAIDIGVTGAMAAVDSHGSAVVHDLPTIAVEGKRLVRRRLDARGLMLLVRQVVAPGESAIAVIEDVHMRPGNGGAATASLMHSRGIVEAVLEIARLQVHAVQPSAWKRHHGLIGSAKAASIDKARALYPLLAGPMLKRQRDHNRAEALLIAAFGHGTMT